MKRHRQLKQGRPFRTLSTSSAVDDDCTCQSGAASGEPTRSEFEDAFSDTVDSYIAARKVKSIKKVGTVSEVADVTCPGKASMRKTNFSVGLTGCTAGSADISNAFQFSMNELLTTFCNSEYRTVTGVSFIGKDGTYDSFAVRFTCQGCADGSQLLDVSRRRTRALIPSTTKIGDENVRILPEANGKCYCDVDAVASRRPTEMEVRLHLFLLTYRTYSNNRC